MKESEIRTNIYDGRERNTYQEELKRLEKWNGNAANKAIIKAFLQFYVAKGSKGGRISKLGLQLRNICNLLNKDLDKITYKDIEALAAEINQHETHSEATKSDYKRMIICFFKWFQDEDKRLLSADIPEREEAKRLYKYIKEHIKRGGKIKSIDYSKIITDEDATLLIDKGCSTILEKAIIAVLHETGCRVGELLGMRIADIELKNKKEGNYAMIRVDGKTGERRIPVIQSLPWLLRYLDEHPDKANQNSLLWLSLEKKRFYGKPLRWIGIKKMLRRIFKKAGIQKKHNAHWFRHSRATILCADYSETILCQLMGWTTGSPQVKTYVHVGAKQVESAFLKINGLEADKKEPKIIKCVCGCTNTAGAKYCYKCGKALSVGTLLEDQDKVKTEIDKTIDFFMEMAKNPELMKRFEEFKNGRGK